MTNETFSLNLIKDVTALQYAVSTGNITVIRATALYLEVIAHTEDFTAELSGDEALVSFVDETIFEWMKMVNDFMAVMGKADYYEIELEPSNVWM